MNAKTRIGLISLGLSIWAMATLIFRAIGSHLFERSALEYWMVAIATGVLCAVVPVGLMKWWRVESKNWLQGAICIALPGMLGEIPVLYGFSKFMGDMQPETAGRYAAFLFVGYASLLGFAWLMSTKATSLLASDGRS